MRDGKRASLQTQGGKSELLDNPVAAVIACFAREGVLLSIAINRYAGVIYALTQGLVFEPDYFDMTVRELSTGVRNNPPPHMKTFREAYFHLPSKLRCGTFERRFRMRAVPWSRWPGLAGTPTSTRRGPTCANATPSCRLRESLNASAF
jgi:hypothetical protein